MKKAIIWGVFYVKKSKPEMDGTSYFKFENIEFFENSIKLRKFDESAKKTDLKIKSINEYKNLLYFKLI